MRVAKQLSCSYCGKGSDEVKPMMEAQDRADKCN
jgi:hypothetical protein